MKVRREDLYKHISYGSAALREKRALLISADDLNSHSPDGFEATYNVASMRNVPAYSLCMRLRKEVTPTQHT